MLYEKENYKFNIMRYNICYFVEIGVYFDSCGGDIEF